MRVIAGKYRGKRLNSPDTGLKTRPTTDRIKETLFNILYSKGVHDGISVLDLFAGSGALGIEALSRGATVCVFVDIEPRCCKLVRDNLSLVGAQGEVYHADYKKALAKLSGRAFDLILLDPPYHRGQEAEIVQRISANGLLHPDGVIVIEHSRETSLACEGFTQDSRICGNTMLTFLSKSGNI